MNNEELLGTAERFGTPTYVFDLEEFRGRLEAVRTLWPGVGLCFSIKANPFLIGAARDEGARLEVCSPGELALCEAWGVDPASVIYSGVCKGEADAREAVRWGAGTLTAESAGQLRIVSDAAVAAGKRVPVLLRLNAGSQFGMSKDDLLWCVDHASEFPGADLVGIHYFAGTQRMKLKHQRRELAMLAELLDELESRHGWRAERLEYGPGLGVPYFEGEDFSDTLTPARELAADLAGIAGRVDLTVEMGRFLATSCGHYLTSVVDQKSNEGTNYAFVDGGMNHVTYLGQMMGLKVPIIRDLSAAARGDGGEARHWSLCGSLCTTADVLVRDTERRDLRVGDVLCFDNIGAYSVTEGIYLFLSRALPRVVLRRGPGDLALARDSVEASLVNLPDGLRK